MGQIDFKNHILICGDIRRARFIIEQLFSEDIRDVHPLVLIHPTLDQTPLDHPLLRVIRGDPIETEVLNQANARHAYAAIILAEGESVDANAVDARNLLIALAIETLQPEIYSCVEVLNPANAVHFHRVNVDEVISVGDISNGLVIQSALNPGVSRFISQILRFDEGDEIYRVAVPGRYVGQTFAELSVQLMQERGLVLAGMISEGEVVSQPAQRRLAEGDCLFVIADSQPEL